MTEIYWSYVFFGGIVGAFVGLLIFQALQLREEELREAKTKNDLREIDLLVDSMHEAKGTPSPRSYYTNGFRIYT